MVTVVFRLSILIAFLLAAVGLLLGQEIVVAVICFAVLPLGLSELAMFEWLGFSKFNVIVGEATQAKVVKGIDTLDTEVLCIPIRIRIDFWQVKNMHAEIESGNRHVATVMYDEQGHSSMNEQFSLTFDQPKGYIALACRKGIIYMGGPIGSATVEGESPYRIRLKLRCRNATLSKSYLLGKDMTLDNDLEGESEHATS